MSKPIGFDSGPQASERVMRRRAQLSAYLGSLLEYYDFYLYGYAAALVLGGLFFPTTDPSVGVLSSFASLAVGFLARPIGALIFGHFGDRLGRRQVLVVTLLIMGLASVAIGLLPTYESIGLWAPAMLIALRISQGVSAGGEFAGALLVAVEHASEHRRALFSSVTQLGLYSGILLANVVLLLVSLLPDDAFMAWGWRVPFLSSIVLVAVTLWIRLKVSETPSFEHARRTGQLASNPLLDLFREQRRKVGLVVMVMIGVTAGAAFCISFLPAYAVASGFSKTQALVMPLIGTVLGMIVVPLAAHVSDLVGRRRVALVGCVFLAFGAWAALEGANTGNWPVTLTLSLIPMVAHSVAYAPTVAWIGELFPTRSRYSGVSVGFQFAATFGAGLFPLIASALLISTGGVPNYMLPLAYFALLLVVSIAGMLIARETSAATFAELDANGEAKHKTERSS
ncbi:MAG: MFS transporter [Mycobacterium sp.]